MPRRSTSIGGVDGAWNLGGGVWWRPRCIETGAAARDCPIQVGLFLRGGSMVNWISRWAMRHAPTPEKTAASMLVTARMELFAAEQRVIDAKLRASYWSTRVAFLEEVQQQGIDPWVHALPSPQPEAEFTPLGAGPRLAAGT